MGAGCLSLAWRVLLGAAALLPVVGSTLGISSQGGGVRGSCPADCHVQDPRSQGEATTKAQGVSDDQDRAPRETSVTFITVRSSSGPGSCHWQQCAPGKVDDMFLGPHKGTPSAAAPCSWRMEVSCRDSKEPRSVEEDAAKALLPGTVTTGTPIRAAGSPQASAQPALLGGPPSRLPTAPRSSTGPLPSAVCTSSLLASTSGPQRPCCWTPHLPGAIQARDPDSAAHPAVPHFPDAGAQAPPALGFRVHLPSRAALRMLVDFGDSLGAEIRLHNVTEALAVTVFHQYGKEGVYVLRAAVCGHPGPEVELGPYYVAVGRRAVSVLMNASSIFQDKVLIFAGPQPGEEGTVVTHSFPWATSCNVSFLSWPQAGDSQAWAGMTVWYQMQPVSVYTNGTVFATDTNITFVAVTKETAPLEFEWHFGDGPPVRTASRSIRKQLGVPQWYRVTVTASSGVGSVVSKPHVLRVQRRIEANRLVSAPTALVNATVAFECRINFGTDVAFLWDFGDGTSSPGGSSASHVYSREGVFTVQVLASNSVSSTTLRKLLFVVGQPCQPPPVKNMGPGKVQMWRSQPLRLGVTFEAAVLCDISQGLSYAWSLTDAGGSPVILPAAVNTHRQTLVLPGYTLDCGDYRATAKVQIRGSVVHSNYSVDVEVRARAPVAVISEGTHLFVPRATGAPVTLRGTQSFDPDHPGAALSYHWACTAAHSPGRPCLDASTPHQLDTRAPVLSFAAEWLSRCCDQFLVTLTVASGGRNSSEAQVFLSTRQDPAFRLLRITWVNFKDVYVNWNEELSLRAVCDDCRETPGLAHSWELFLVNATEDSRRGVPFCSTVRLLGAAALGATRESSESDLPTTEPSEAHPVGTPTRSPQETPPAALRRPVLTVLGSASVGVPAAGDTVAPGEPSEDGPPPSSSSALDDFEAYYSDIQEAELAAGRQPGNSASLPGSEPSMDAAEGSPGDGDNLLGPFASADRALPVLAIDWPKAPVSRAVFQGYTAAGVTEPTVTIKPYSLRSGETYVLQASVAAEPGLLGRAQLYVTVSRAPQDTACQVQPHRGLEALTVFSVFCMSGTPDFHYEFSYQIGNTSRHTLYRGRDTQYYFALPAGDPLDNYKVMVSTEIMDGRGSRGQPCSMAVTVLPRYHGNSCPSEDLYVSGLRNLSTLQLMGSDAESRNYVAMLTGILSRLAKENASPACDQWSPMQDVLISAVCKLAFADQGEMMDSVLTLQNLVSLPIKLSFRSAAHVFRFTRTLLGQGRGQFSRTCVGAGGLGLELILLISRVWGACEHGKSGNEDYVREEGMRVISDVLLDVLSRDPGRQLSLSVERMEFQVLLHRGLQSSVQSLGSVLVHLPGDLAGLRPAAEETQGPGYVSQLMLFRESPYPGHRAAGQVGSIVVLRLYSWPGRSPIRRGRLETPVTVEFGDADGHDKTNEGTSVLLRGKVNLHRLAGPSQHPQESLRIHIVFAKPEPRPFPVLVLVSFSGKPSPTDFLVRRTHFWDEESMHIYVPADPGQGASVGYLSLLDADYDRRPPNKYLTEAVSYTVHLQWVRCLFWDKREWKSGSFSPQPGTSPGKINCSHDRLAPFSVLRRKVNASFEAGDISQLQSSPQNLLPSVCMVVFTVLCGLLVVKSRLVDRHEEKKTGCIFLQEAAPPGHQLYAVVVDTGFWAPARLTSRVFIILCGENGLSETKELRCPEKPLFERNSRHTFILSAPAWLGPFRKVRLWHDGSGPAPSWFLSRVMVKELRSGQGWFFPARCWLAAGWGDGRVQRELPCLRRGLGFWELFCTTFAESLAVRHVWLSLCGPPGPLGLPRTQHLAVCFCLLCVHSCLAALAAIRGQEQLPLDIGPTDVTLGALGLGLLCAMAASPSAQLLSLLFRRSKEAKGRPRAEPLGPGTGTQTEAPRDPNSHGRMLSVQEDYKPAAATASGSDMACYVELEARGAWRRRLCHGPRSQSDDVAAAPSSGLEGLTPQASRSCPAWPSAAAWTACGLVSLACGLGTGFLGYRFLPAQCAQWLLLLTLSVVCCAFVTQPLLICCAALGFAWKRRDDSQFFAESLHDATRNLDLELGERLGPHTPASPGHRAFGPEAELAKVLAARQQERHLRWAQPPSRARLRVTRARMRRESRTRAALRDVALHISVLLLLLWTTFGTFSADGHSLNRAIRKEFVSHARHSRGGLRSAGDWWDQSLSSLLGGLHVRGASAAGAPGAQPPQPSPALPEDSFPLWSPEARGLEHGNVTHGGPGGCRARKGTCVLSLGRTSHEAHTAMSTLRASGWMDTSTGAVSLRLALYDPPTRLFASVTLSRDILPARRLVPSVQVESFRVFRDGRAPWYHRVLPELAFLGLTLVYLSVQLYAMAEEGALSYWRRPRNWLELPAIGVALAYYAVMALLTSLAGDVANQIRIGPSWASLDLSPMAVWNQRARWLRGLLLFLWTLKCVSLPGLRNVAAASWCSRLRGSTSGISTLVLVGALLLAAHAHLRPLLCATWTLPLCTVTHSSPQLLLLGLPGRSQEDSFQGLSVSHRQPVAGYCGALSTVTAALCLGVLRVSLLTYFRRRKSFRGKSQLRLKDVAAYAWRKVLAFLGLETPTLEETEAAADHNHYLDDFASLLDELLAKINALSDSLDLPVLEEPSRTSESRVEDGPVVGVSGCQATGLQELPAHHFRLQERDWEIEMETP